MGCSEVFDLALRAMAQHWFCTLGYGAKPISIVQNYTLFFKSLPYLLQGQ
jgi:hypothetical protein